MSSHDQFRTPLFDAVKKYVDDRVIPFHVPGHKQGRGLAEMAQYLGPKVLQMDANGMEDLDYINHPTGVIAEAQQLYADACGADCAFFLVNGTTSGVQAMIMSVCGPGSEIIMPRNAHKSAFGGIILSGAVPVYIQPEINREYGIAMGITPESLMKAIKDHPHASAVFVINPTYYGAASDLATIVSIAHDHGMAVLVDEAHGAHMGFNKEFPLSAIAAGADMSSASVHKTGGSLTQSSVLLLKSSMVPADKVRQVLSLTYTSSASYILLCSLDIARKQLATAGNEMLDCALKMVRRARKSINRIEGLSSFGREMIGMPGCFSIDETKLCINVRKLGVTGYKIETILRKQYNIQIELSDIYNILAIVSLGDCEENLDQLTNAMRKISSVSSGKEVKNSTTIPTCPKMIVSPRDAFYLAKKVVRLENAAGEISGEMVMAYPPGIPVICMGERITDDLIDYLKLLKSEKCELQGTADPYLNYIRVLGNDN